MIPAVPDHMFVYWASHSYVEELLDSGVRAYTYNNGFLHAKTIVIDGAVLRSDTNWTSRSFRLNFETNALMYDERVAGELKQAFSMIFLSVPSLPCHGMRATVLRQVFVFPSLLRGPVIPALPFLRTRCIPDYFIKSFRYRFNPGIFLLIVDLEWGHGREYSPGNYPRSHSFMEGICCGSDDYTFLC